MFGSEKSLAVQVLVGIEKSASEATGSVPNLIEIGIVVDVGEGGGKDCDCDCACGCDRD